MLNLSSTFSILSTRDSLGGAEPPCTLAIAQAQPCKRASLHEEWAILRRNAMHAPRRQDRRGKKGRKKGGKEGGKEEGRKKEEGTNKPDNKVAAAAAVSASVASDDANCWVCTGLSKKCA